MGTPPLLFLLLLLSSLPQASEAGCNDRTACIYCTACIDAETITRNESMVTKVYAVMQLRTATNFKKNCSGAAFISRLSIESTSTYSWNFSFMTDMKDVSFGIGKAKSDHSWIEFRTTGTLKGRLLGIDLVLNHTKTRDHLGRHTYAFRVENPQGYTLRSLIGRTISFEGRTFNFPEFWKDLVSKLACDPTLIHDTCYEASDCTKVVITNHTLSCTSGYEFQLRTSDEKWHRVESTTCNNERWNLATSKKNFELGTDSREKADVVCRQRVEKTTTLPPPTDATITPYSIAKANSTSDPFPSVDGEEVENPDPAAIHKDNSTVKPTPRKLSDSKPHDDHVHFPGTKWMYIGGGTLLLMVIIIVNIIGCVACRRKKNSTTKKDKTSKKSKKRNNKKKGGKKPQSESSNQPSSSESADPATKPLKGAKNEKPLPPSSSDDMTNTVKPDGRDNQVTQMQVTEMNLDVLKTEFA